MPDDASRVSTNLISRRSFPSRSRPGPDSPSSRTTPCGIRRRMPMEPRRGTSLKHPSCPPIFARSAWGNSKAKNNVISAPSPCAYGMSPKKHISPALLSIAQSRPCNCSRSTSASPTPTKNSTSSRYRISKQVRWKMQVRSSSGKHCFFWIRIRSPWPKKRGWPRSSLMNSHICGSVIWSP